MKEASYWMCIHAYLASVGFKQLYTIVEIIKLRKSLIQNPCEYLPGQKDVWHDRDKGGPTGTFKVTVVSQEEYLIDGHDNFYSFMALKSILHTLYPVELDM